MKSKKIAASILAFSLITSAAASDTGIISKLIPTNNIFASAAYETISSSDWEFKITNDNTAEIKKYTGSSSVINIPGEITDPETNQTYTVSTILNTTFRSCMDSITSVSFPSGIKFIESNILWNATNLTQVYIPDGVTTIYDLAFANTPNLKSITLPDTLEVISNSAFKNSGLTSVTFPSSLRIIKDYAFDGTNLTTVTLPSTLEFVDFYAFGECPNLKNATIKCNCDMGRCVFGDSNNLANVNISSDCLDAVFSSGALGRCPNLKTINNVQIVRKGADGRPYLYSQSIPYIKKILLYWMSVKFRLLVTILMPWSNML
ncbi:MAG TPA: leucine-rich repeat domain-containing protein [Ruminococcus sp.]|nr:leucine-rich repeat domain-containing protein [Ruminococcus sp.]